MNKRPRTPEQLYAQLFIVSAALAGSPLIYGLVIILLSRMSAAEPVLRDPLLPWYFLAGALVMIGTALIFRGKFLDPTRLAGRLPAGGEDEVRPALYQAIMVAHILPLAAAETAGVLGVVVYVLTRDLAAGLLLAGMSLCAMGLLVPRRAAIDELLRRVGAARRGREGREGR